MKEVTYGWYPSVKDVYKPKGRPSSYHLECLYKHGNSTYYQGQVAPPEGELFVRGVSSATPPPTPQDLRRKTRSVPVPKFRPVPKIHIPTPTQCWAAQKVAPSETKWGVVGEDHTPLSLQGPEEVNWPLPSSKKQQQQQQQQWQQYLQQKYQQHHHRQQKQQQQQQQQQFLQQQQQQIFQQQQQDNHVQYAWGLKPSREPSPPPSIASNTELTWPKAHTTVPPRPQSSYSGQQFSSREEQQKCQSKQKTRPTSSPVKTSGQVSPQGQGQKGAKQTATQSPRPPSYGKTSGSAKRPARIQSATVRRDRTPLPSRPVTACAGNRTPFKIEPELEIHAESTTSPPARPAAPVPFVYDVNENLQQLYLEDGPQAAQIQLNGNGPTYEDIVDRHGWVAEVHGDPYNLKRPLKRVSYAVKCEVPDLMPDPPNVHMETNEPFFLNTIPRKPATFSVDKEWMSEVLLAKRLDLQKREGGIKYSYKNFSFVY